MSAACPEPEDQTLESLLAIHGLTHWLPLVTEWCSRFEGWQTAFELHDEPTHDAVPVSQVMLALSALPSSLEGSDDRFARLLADCDFVSFHAGRDQPREGWNPLDESFRTFASRGEYKIWDTDKAFTASSTISYWLLGRLFSYQLTRQTPRAGNAGSGVSQH